MNLPPAQPGAVFAVIVQRMQVLHELMWETPATIPMLVCALGYLSMPTVSELGACCGISMKNASRALKILRARGWVVFEGDKKDERKKLVKLTPAGQQIVKGVLAELVHIAMLVEGAKPNRR
jgi:DNA-binding MarR family transcriptional regulator